jgi:fructose-specific phosphotransferase system component IIB
LLQSYEIELNHTKFAAQSLKKESMSKLKNKVAVITGGNSGIGFVIA